MHEHRGDIRMLEEKFEYGSWANSCTNFARVDAEVEC